MMKSSMAEANFENAAANTTPAMSIVVPCRNERDQIEAAMESILAQEPPPGEFEVIVVDGMSDDGDTRDPRTIGGG